jgi:hypothetical protein
LKNPITNCINEGNAEPAEETIAKFSPEIPEAAETNEMKGWERFNAKFLIMTYVLKGFIT